MTRHPGNVPLHGEGADIAQTHFTERRQQVVFHDTPVSVLRALCEYGHHDGQVNILNVNSNLLADPKLKKPMVHRPETFGDNFLHLPLWHRDWGYVLASAFADPPSFLDHVLVEQE